MLLYGGGVAWRVKGACRRRGWVIVLIGRAHVSLMARSAQGGLLSRKTRSKEIRTHFATYFPPCGSPCAKGPKKPEGTQSAQLNTGISTTPLSGGKVKSGIPIGVNPVLIFRSGGWGGWAGKRYSRLAPRDGSTTTSEPEHRRCGSISLNLP